MNYKTLVHSDQLPKLGLDQLQLKRGRDSWNRRVIMITYSKDMYHRKSKHTDKQNVSLKKELKPGIGNFPRVPITNITQKSF